LDAFYKSRLWYLIWAYILSIYLSLPVMRSVLRALKDSLGKADFATALSVLMVVAAAITLAIGLIKGWSVFLKVLLPIATIALISINLHIPEEQIHFLQYGLLGAMVMSTARNQSMVLMLKLTAFTLAIGVIDELIQWMLPNRVGDPRDVAFNAIAGILGLWIGHSLRWGSSSASS
jgi:VanZ family protein